jgi:hypothetical protein
VKNRRLNPLSDYVDLLSVGPGLILGRHNAGPKHFESFPPQLAIIQESGIRLEPIERDTAPF